MPLHFLCITGRWSKSTKILSVDLHLCWPFISFSLLFQHISTFIKWYIFFIFFACINIRQDKTWLVLDSNLVLGFGPNMTKLNFDSFWSLIWHQYLLLPVPVSRIQQNYGQTAHWLTGSGGSKGHTLTSCKTNQSFVCVNTVVTNANGTYSQVMCLTGCQMLSLNASHILAKKC